MAWPALFRPGRVARSDSTGGVRVKITGIRLDRLRRPLDPPFLAAWDPVPRRWFDATLVRVETDEGLTGYGSGDTMDGFETYADLFVGQDPRQITRHVRVLETISFHAGRYWPLEAALWDIIGQAAGQPVAALFGGAATRIPAYASFGEARAPQARAEAALAAQEAGFRAVKLRIDRRDPAAGLAAVAAVRAAAGDSLEIMADLNQWWRMAGDVSVGLDQTAVRLLAAGLADLGVCWLEEPLPGGDWAGMRALREQAGIRVAGGEMARSPAELLDALAAGALDVVQPDVVLSVGLSRARTVAEVALLQGRWFTPHTWTNGLGLLANLHVAAGVGGGPWLEYPWDPPGWTAERRDFFLAEPVRPDADGCLAVPDSPGLGARIDEAAVARWAAP
jgi:L-alanine-DL-glutamate epimerase-like enolase superfamily enzyme